MNTGKHITAMVKEMLKNATEQGKYLYMAPLIKDFNPMRIITVRTCQGLTVAKTINGGEVPVSSLNIDRFYIQ